MPLRAFVCLISLKSLRLEGIAPLAAPDERWQAGQAAFPLLESFECVQRAVDCTKAVHALVQQSPCLRRLQCSFPEHLQIALSVGGGSFANLHDLELCGVILSLGLASNLRNLTKLCLLRGDADIPSLWTLTTLRQLSLADAAFLTSDLFDGLSRLSGLTSLTLPMIEEGTGWVSEVEALPSLSELAVSVSADVLPQLDTLADKIVDLRIDDEYEEFSAGSTRIDVFQRLRALTLWRFSFVPQFLPLLSALTEVAIAGVRLPSLAALFDLLQLKRLGIEAIHHVADLDLAGLSRLTNLSFLRLERVMPALPALHRVPLEQLDVYRTDFDFQLLMPLAQHPTLRSILLYACALDNMRDGDPQRAFGHCPHFIRVRTVASESHQQFRVM
eukprot:TRINITY_DN23596_c0_g1_i1.p1 TRINITY_DN23596_c0_g1~~TRINITY_DN23596_c0_g1_i1.p1  ORF type:complete len:443 (-),score=61.61 TRINITY_DN23596_c0_g1_i1:51-1211(-)